jgi:hypothetical protein
MVTNSTAGDPPIYRQDQPDTWHIETLKSKQPHYIYEAFPLEAVLDNFAQRRVPTPISAKDMSINNRLNTLLDDGYRWVRTEVDRNEDSWAIFELVTYDDEVVDEEIEP